jgi:hypothetical protein
VPKVSNVVNVRTTWSSRKGIRPGFPFSPRNVKLRGSGAPHNFNPLLKGVLVFFRQRRYCHSRRRCTWYFWQSSIYFLWGGNLYWFAGS